MKMGIKWIHFVGICGVTMGPIANMFKKKKWKVTGSDKGIFPPMSDYLKKRKIEIQLGFKKEHLKGSHYGYSKKHPDVVVVGNYVGLGNTEYKYAVEKSLQINSYPEVLQEHLIKSNSVVVSGTYGKTTSTGLLTLILKEAGMNPSYMIGGLARNFKDPVKNTRSKWSVIEGDEYISARFDEESKFFHYHPEFVLLTAAAWEHTDFFKTESDYIENFKRFVKKVSRNGIIVACKYGKNNKEVLKEARCKVVWYELNKIDQKLVNSDWFNLPHKENPEIGEIVIYNKNRKEEFSVKTDLFGDHNRENIIGSVTLARELDIDIEHIQKAVEKYKGIKRRLEIRYEEENLRIIDDHACSPPKVIGSLEALREKFNNWHITIIFEPNVGNRTENSRILFKGVFDKADEVIIPHLKPVRVKKGENRVSGEDLAEYLKQIGTKSKYIENDEELVKYVSGKDVGKHVICFMGAYGWRNMIEEVVGEFSN